MGPDPQNPGSPLPHTLQSWAAHLERRSRAAAKALKESVLMTLGKGKTRSAEVEVQGGRGKCAQKQF